MDWKTLDDAVRIEPGAKSPLKRCDTVCYHLFPDREAAEASLELLVRAALGQHKDFFRLQSYRVIDQKVGPDDTPFPEATLRVHVGLHEVHTAAVGNGPVDALYNALLKALVRFYPRLMEVSLEDYKVRVLPGMHGTSAKVRVFVESRDAHEWWGTVGVSHDIIEASWQALVDSINYKRFKDEQGFARGVAAPK